MLTNSTTMQVSNSLDTMVVSSSRTLIVRRRLLEVEAREKMSVPLLRSLLG